MLEVLQFPDPVLFTPAEKIKEFDAELRAFANSMKEITKTERAVGLTANQVGRPINLMIVHDPEMRITYTLCNVKILEGKGSQTGPEGCVSQKGVFIDKERPMEITAVYQTVFGEYKTIKLRGLAGRCLAHEEGHLRGVVPTEDENFPYPWVK